MDKLYHLKVESVARESISIVTGSEVENKVDLLHQRLGHLNKLQLRELTNKDLVKGVNTQAAVHCLYVCTHPRVHTAPEGVVCTYQAMHSCLCYNLLSLRLLCSKFYLLFFPEFPKNFAHYSFDHYLLFS